MNKMPDFGKNLSSITESVATDVGDVLQVLASQKKKASLAAVPQTFAVEKEKVPDSEPAEVEPSRLQPPSPRQSRRSVKNKLAGQLADEIILENVTTRLRRETNELLTETALRQRLKKTFPATRQDIVEVALRDWFKKEGYEK